MAAPTHPTIMTRLRALVAGERDAATVEALRAAGSAVYSTLATAETRRAALCADGQDPWTAPAHLGGYLAAAWNAFVCQSLAAALVDADYAADPGTVGFLPPVTFDQAWTWFSVADGWRRQAAQADANPGYLLTDVFDLPAALPAWVEVEPCPAAHLQAMLTALPSLREHAELAIFDLEKAATDDTRRRDVARLRQDAADAAAAVDYATALGAAAGRGRLHELIETNLKHAVAMWFRIGQLAALPGRIASAAALAGPGRPDLASLPGGHRFDPWCLTDPATVDQWRADPRARRAIDALWAADPDPAATLVIHHNIQKALAAGIISAAHRPGEGGYYFCCPWSPIYVVRRPITLAGVRLAAAARFTYDVSAEGVADGEPFVRRILPGPFATTSDVDYCDPQSGHHD